MKRNVGHFGPEYLFIQVSEILYDMNIGKIVFWWQGMNFYPLNPKMGIKDNFISKWF